jgi:Putative adhesin
LVGMLIAAEVLIVGVALYAIRPTGWSGIHARAIAAASLPPIEAGSAPAIAVEDPDSRVVIAVSHDGLVHVRDLSHASGFTGDTDFPPLQVQRTGDGVSITRAARHTHWIVFFGSLDERTEVDVPPGSHIAIAKCSGADVDGISGPVNVRSQDGHIELSNVTGTVDADSSDGRIEATNVRTDSLTLHSADGRIILHDVSADTIDAVTNDGRIIATGLSVTGPHAAATLHSDDGSVELGLSADSNVTIVASTNDGRIVVDGRSYRSDDSDAVGQTVRLGDGSANARVSTNDGSIHITTNNGA